jgi:hypothetical protein
MKKLFTSLAIFGLLFGFLTAQNGPCTDFDNKVPGSVQTNHSASLVTLLDNWSTRCADLQYSNTGSQLGASDVYLRGLDWGCGNAGSLMYNSIDYAGDWLSFGSCFCYDFRIFVNGNTVPAPPTNLSIYWGPDPLNTTYSARFVLTNPVSVADGWVTICPPIELADNAGNLPSNADGQWVLTKGSGAAAWDSLIQNVTGVMYSLDIGASPTEQYGFDNICFTNCPGEESPCDRLNLAADFIWETTDSLWHIDLKDISTVDTSGSIAFVEWYVDSTYYLGLGGDSLHLDLGGPGTYDVCLHIYGFAIDSNGVNICCKDTICQTINLTICDYHNPDIAVTSISGNTATLLDNSANGTYSIWLADTSDAASMYVSGGAGTSISHTYPGPGTYTARLISWWHYDGVLCCIDTVYETIVIGQQHSSPCDSLKPWADFSALAMYTNAGSTGYVFTDMSAAGTISRWYINSPITGPGNPVTGGPGSTTPLIWLGPGVHRICLVSEIATAVGIVCRDTFCMNLTVHQQPVIALCDTHRARFSAKLGKNFYAEFTDNSNYGDSTYWFFNGSLLPDTATTGPGTIAQHQFNGPGPHRICMVSVWYPFPNNPHIACRDTFCRNIMFATPIQVSTPPRLIASPNPTRGTASLNYPPQMKMVQFTLTDLRGNVLKKWEDEGDGNTIVDTEGIPKGLYLISMPMEKGKVVTKLMKQ